MNTEINIYQKQLILLSLLKEWEHEEYASFDQKLIVNNIVLNSLRETIQYIGKMNK